MGEREEREMREEERETNVRWFDFEPRVLYLYSEHRFLKFRAPVLKFLSGTRF